MLHHPFLGRAFRPFFLFGALYAVLSVTLWVPLYMGDVPPFMAWSFDPALWHGHEMVFGFAVAIIAGFLLTAVANWTGGAPARSVHLGALVLLWLAGRVTMNLPLPEGLVAAVDLAFIPAVALSLSIPLLRSWNKRNFVFLGLLTILFACNALTHFSGSREALYVAIIVIISVISLVGGRIIPAFTVAALRRSGVEAYQTPQPGMDVAALASLAALMIAIPLMGLVSPVTGGIAAVSAVIHAVRMRHYHVGKVWRDPLLWIMHVGYGWAVLGLVLTALAGFGQVSVFAALHALTLGAIGSMTIGMMVRVALGHTGRPLKAGRVAVTTFVVMQLAAITRVFGPIAFPSYYTEWVAASGVLWAISYALYILTYAPVLWGPRPDGREA